MNPEADCQYESRGNQNLRLYNIISGRAEPDLKEIEKCLKNGADPFSSIKDVSFVEDDDDKYTIFQYAIKKNKQTAVLAFISHCSDYNLKNDKVYISRDNKWCTIKSFSVAAYILECKNFDLLDQIKENLPEKVGVFFETFLTSRGSPKLNDFVNGIIDEKLYQSVDESGAQILHDLIQSDKRVTFNLVKLVEKDSQLLFSLNAQKQNVIHHLITSENSNSLRILEGFKDVIAENPELLEQKDIEGYTPLASMAKKAIVFNKQFDFQEQAMRVDKMDVLLSLGANPSAVDNKGWTILDRFCQKGDEGSPLVKLLIVQGGCYQKQFSTLFTQVASSFKSAPQPNVSLMKVQKHHRATQIKFSK